MNFIDTGAFIALYLAEDQYHHASLTGWRELQGSQLTSNLVIAETGTLLSRSIGNKEAANRINNIYSSESFDIIESSREYEFEALTWMRKFSDQGVSFTDCVSFAIMRRHRIKTAFTFDRHFKLAGFQVIGLK